MMFDVDHAIEMIFDDGFVAFGVREVNLDVVEEWAECFDADVNVVARYVERAMDAAIDDEADAFNR